MSRVLAVGIAAHAISRDSRVALVSYGLGSCVGVAVYDPRRCVGGLLHFMLPQATLNPAKARENPAMFGDTGIPLLFNQMHTVGSRLPDLQVYLVGGAALLSASALFAVGDRNVAMAKLLLDKNHIVPRGCQLGGQLSRTVRLEIATGRCVVIAAGRKEIQL